MVEIKRVCAFDSTLVKRNLGYMYLCTQAGLLVSLIVGKYSLLGYLAVYETYLNPTLTLTLKKHALLKNVMIYLEGGWCLTLNWEVSQTL